MKGKMSWQYEVELPESPGHVVWALGVAGCGRKKANRIARDTVVDVLPPQQAFHLFLVSATGRRSKV
jgi:hypothetical protein